MFRPRSQPREYESCPWFTWSLPVFNVDIVSVICRLPAVHMQVPAACNLIVSGRGLSAARLWGQESFREPFSCPRPCDRHIRMLNLEHWLLLLLFKPLHVYLTFS